MYRPPVRGAQQGFVPGKGVQRAAHCPYVHGRAAQALRPIHQAQNAFPAGKLANLFHWLYRPCNVGGVRHDNQTRVGPYGILHVARIHKIAARPHERHLDFAAPLLFHQHPQNTVVLQHGAHHMAARFQASLDGQIERVRAIERVYDAKGIPRAQRARQRFPRFQHQPPRRQRTRVARAPRIRVEAGHGVLHRPERTRRLWVARGRVVQIDFHAHSPIHSFRRVWRIL